MVGMKAGNTTPDELLYTEMRPVTKPITPVTDVSVEKRARILVKRSMPPFRIDFDLLDWQSTLPGLRFKTHREGSKQIRLMEFTSDFVEPQWCEKEHAGIVLEGTLEIDFHGRFVTFPPGAGIFIPGGASSGHKARAATPVARIVLVEDVAPS